MDLRVLSRSPLDPLDWCYFFMKGPAIASRGFILADQLHFRPGGAGGVPV